jgi:hypothetical protein
MKTKTVIYCINLLMALYKFNSYKKDNYGITNECYFL